MAIRVTMVSVTPVCLGLQYNTARQSDHSLTPARQPTAALCQSRKMAGVRLPVESNPLGQTSPHSVMGLVTQGIPEQITIELARLNRCTTFVETGTYLGRTTRWASKYFESVHTIERAEGLYRLHSRALSQIHGVTTYLGDSRGILPQILKNMRGSRAVFWLDAHRSGEETAGQHDACPLLDELACLSNRTEDIILIDDARMFLSAPPQPHDPSQWPCISDIVSVLLASTHRPFIQVVDDVIFAVPNQDALRSRLVQYAQMRASEAESRTLSGRLFTGGHVKRLLWIIGQRLTTR
jgi:hypothetical protein